MRTQTITVAAAALCLLCVTSGCLYELRDEILECDTNLWNHRRAYATWRACYPTYRSIDNFHDFKHGFITGYKTTAAGGNGCPPALPPTEYWKPSHQNEWGKAKANTWFDGFSHGVLAAQSDGVVEMNRIVTRTTRTDFHGQEPLPDEEYGPPPQGPPVDEQSSSNPPLLVLPSPAPPYEPDQSDRPGTVKPAPSSLEAAPSP